MVRKVSTSTMRDGSFPFGTGTGKPTLVRGHLPLKFQWITHTKRLRLLFRCAQENYHDSWPCPASSPVYETVIGCSPWSATLFRVSTMSTIERRRSFSSGGNTMLPFLGFCKGYTAGEVTWHSPVWSRASHKYYRCFRIMEVVDTMVRQRTGEIRVSR